MNKEEYNNFIEALLGAHRVVAKDFESKELFQACQPIEEIARKGRDAPRFGALKPVGLVDPRTERRPWAVVQLRAEDRSSSCFNLVGFQTNLKFAEQERVFRMIPGLEKAEFARFGVMHRNTFIDAPKLLDHSMRLQQAQGGLPKTPVYFAGQIAGTEGYCEAIMSGWLVAVGVFAFLEGVSLPPLPQETSFGSLVAYATDPQTIGYQPMHVNFGIQVPLNPSVKNKQDRYHAYAERGTVAFEAYLDLLRTGGLVLDSSEG